MSCASSLNSVDVVRPQPGHAVTAGRNERRANAWRISWHSLTSRARSPPGSGVRLLLMVSPMPSSSKIDSAAVVATTPFVPIPASVNPRCRGGVCLVGKFAVGRDHLAQARDLARNDYPVRAQAETDRLIAAPQRALDEGFLLDIIPVQRFGPTRIGVHLFDQQLLIEAPGVHPDPDGLPEVPGDLDERSEILVATVAATHIARVDTELSKGGCAIGVVVQQTMADEVKVADQRYEVAAVIEARPDFGNGAGGGIVVNRDPD